MPKKNKTSEEGGASNGGSGESAEPRREPTSVIQNPPSDTEVKNGNLDVVHTIPVDTDVITSITDRLSAIESKLNVLDNMGRELASSNTPLSPEVQNADIQPLSPPAPAPPEQNNNQLSQLMPLLQLAGGGGESSTEATLKDKVFDLWVDSTMRALSPNKKEIARLRRGHHD